MKMIYVYGDDFATLEFEKYFHHKEVSEIIQRFFIDDEEHDGDFEMELYEFDEIDPRFIEFIRRRIQDYDQSKHENFYFENDLIKF